MQNTLNTKTAVRDKKYNDLVTILQILMYEESFSKNTYDKLYGNLVDMEKNQPTKQDFLKDLLSECQKTTLLPPGNSSNHMVDAFVNTIVLPDGHKYMLTLTKTLF